MSNDKRSKVPIPEGASTYSDRVTFTFGHIYSEKQGRNIPNRMQIGTPCEDDPGMMCPNDKYMVYFAEEYEKNTGMSALIDMLSIGLNPAVSLIADNTKLRLCLENVFGEKRTNSILDYAMYLILFHSNASEHYSYRMETQLVFSDRIYSDSYWSAFFKDKVKLKEIKRFKTLWAQQCVKRGIKVGYASYDGSNSDCDSKKTDYAQKGKAKSGKNGNIFGYMYCLAEDGTPLTYDVYDGSDPDSNEIKNMISFLKSLGIEIPGAIIDRGFDDQKCLDELLKLVDDYVVKLKENTEGFTNAVKEKGKDVRAFSRTLRIPHSRILGTTVESKLFKNSPSPEWVHIFYDFENGGERAFTLLDEVDGAIEDINKYIAGYIEYEKKWEEEHKKRQDDKKAKEKAKKSDKKKPFSPSVPGKLKKYIKIEGETPETAHIVIDDKQLDEDLGIKGMFAIGTHKKMTAEEALYYYRLRDIVEKMFDIIKSMLGFRRIRTDSTDSLESRMLIAFVAAILVHELETISKDIAKEKHSSNPKYDTTITVDHLQAVHMSLLPNGTYGLQHKSLSKVKPVFKRLHAPDDILEKTVEEAGLCQYSLQKKLDFHTKKFASVKSTARRRREDCLGSSSQKQYQLYERESCERYQGIMRSGRGRHSRTVCA